MADSGLPPELPKPEKVPGTCHSQGGEGSSGAVESKTHELETLLSNVELASTRAGKQPTAGGVMSTDHEEPMETEKSGDAASCSEIELGEEGPDMFSVLYPIRSKWPIQTLDTTSETG